MAVALARHDAILEGAITSHGGHPRPKLPLPRHSRRQRRSRHPWSRTPCGRDLQPTCGVARRGGTRRPASRSRPPVTGESSPRYRSSVNRNVTVPDGPAMCCCIARRVCGRLENTRYRSPYDGEADNPRIAVSTVSPQAPLPDDVLKASSLAEGRLASRSPPALLRGKVQIKMAKRLYRASHSSVARPPRSVARTHELVSAHLRRDGTRGG